MSYITSTSDGICAKYLLVVGAVSCATIAVGITVYGQYREVSQNIEGRQHNSAVRERIGEFIDQGNGLMRECAIKEAPPPEDAANAWANTVEAYLAAQLGASYVIRFRDPTGTPSMALNGADPAHQNLWFGIYIRMLRLEQFSREIP